MKDLWKLKREFLEYCEIEKGQSLLTISNYERYLNRFLTWLENENPKSEKLKSEKANKLMPDDIDRETIRKYRLYVNRIYNKNGKELKSTTQNHHILALRAFLRYLSMQGIKTVSPDEIALAKVGERKVNFLTAEEYRRLLNAPQKNSRDKAILELLFSTGMRVSELKSLNVGDINFGRGEIAVLGKGKRVRVVFVSEEAIKSLVEYLQMRKALQINPKPEILNPKQIQNLKSKKNNITMSEETRTQREPTSDSNKTMGRPNSNGEIKYFIPDTSKKLPLFLSSRGKRLNVRGIERLVQKYAKIAGITKTVSPHTLRHTFATDLLIAGADIRSVQSLLGHSNISTTQVYTHVTDQHLRDIHKKFHNRQDNNMEINIE